MKKKEKNKAFLKIQAEITKLLNEDVIDLNEAKELHLFNNKFKNPDFFINDELIKKKYR